MKTIRAILVDDEEHALETLEWDIQQYCPNVSILSACNTASGAFKSIQSLKPDLVFLDIEMPKMNAFQLLEQFDEINFEVIFCTAYDRYAIRAFKVSAVDYLLKPINKDELIHAVQRVMDRLYHKKESNRIDILLENLHSWNWGKIALHTVEGIEVVPIEQIIYCRSESNYTHVFAGGGRHIMVSKTLKSIEELLPDAIFCRTHHSFIVNIQHIIKYSKGDSTIHMDNGGQVPVSRSRKEIFLDLLNS